MVTNNQRLPITTYLGHTDRAIGFYEADSSYIALGKTSKWDGEDNPDFIPPVPDIDADTLFELAVLKKIDQKQLVIQADDGELEFDGQKWKIITQDKAKEQRARWVYISTTIKYDEVQLTQYRQVGIFNRVKPKDGVIDKVLLPNQVSDLGLLIALNNRFVVTRQTDTKDTYSLIIEF